MSLMELTTTQTTRVGSAVCRSVLWGVRGYWKPERGGEGSSGDDASKLHHEHESRFFRGVTMLQSCVWGSAG